MSTSIRRRRRGRAVAATRAIAIVMASFLVAACSARPDSDQGGSWTGTVTTEGFVTTVVNEAGSVWGGEAELVEDLSIGVDLGADEYMFGWIRNIYATDERIYVSDSQVPAVRIYDLAGSFLGDLGSGPGQGPGEYQSPSLLAGTPDGRVFVYDGNLERINVYGASGDLLDTWTAHDTNCCGLKMMASADGTLWVPTIQWRFESPTGETRSGVQGYREPDGALGDIRWAPQRDFPRVVEGRDGVTVPFAAHYAFAIGANGSVVAGTTDRYRYEVHARDGSSMVVDRYWDPVPVPPDQAEWARRWNAMNVGSSASVGTNETDVGSLDLPDHKPAFRSLIPTVTGEVWVLRAGASRRVTTPCVEDPRTTDARTARDDNCWESDRYFDIFDAGGRYLGQARVPEGLDSWPQLEVFARGDVVYMAIEDDVGIRKVKRYRLQLPPRAR